MMPAAARMPPIACASTTENTQPEGAEPHRLAPDPLEVDLVAGEEEEHPEAEVGEEFDEAVGPGDVENLGADQDAEQELDDDHRGHEAARHGGDGHRRKRGGEDDDEEGLGVDVKQGGGDSMAAAG